MQAVLYFDSARSLLGLSDRFSRWHEDHGAALRCLDHVFSSLPKLQVASASEVATSLQHFLLYARLLQKSASEAETNPCDNTDIKRLLGFEVATEDLFLVSRDTRMFVHYSLAPRQTDQGALVHRWELEKPVTDNLKERLRSKVNGLNELCSRLRALQPCLAFAAYSRCVRSESSECPQEHLNMDNYDTHAYNLRVRIVLQQILIYQTIYSIEQITEVGFQRR